MVRIFWKVRLHTTIQQSCFPQFSQNKMANHLYSSTSQTACVWHILSYKTPNHISHRLKRKIYITYGKGEKYWHYTGTEWKMSVAEEYTIIEESNLFSYMTKTTDRQTTPQTARSYFKCNTQCKNFHSYKVRIIC